MSPSRPIVWVLVAVLALAAHGADAPASAPSTAPLPVAAQQALEAFRKVPWSERLKPARPDPVPEGWQDRLRAEWALAAAAISHGDSVAALLADEDKFVRALAVKALGLTGDARHTKALLASLAADKDKMVRIALIEALARTGGDDVLPAIEAQQTAGMDADLQQAIGLARRQLKGGSWDVASMRAEFVEGPGTPMAVAKKGEEAPEIALPSPDLPVNLSKYRGKIVVLAFVLGDRSEPCMRVLQRLTQELEKFAKLDVQVVVVDPHEKERTAAWKARLRVPFVFASDPAGRAQATYGVARQLVVGGEWAPSPAWFVINAKGKLVWSKIGRHPAEHASLGDLLPVLDAVSRGIVVR